MSVIHKIKASLLDPEADNYNPKALQYFIDEEIPDFCETYGIDWGVEVDEIFYPPETDGHSIQFRAEDTLTSLVEQMSGNHPGLYFELYYCAPGEFSGITEFVGGELWEEQYTTDTEEGRALSDWHKEQLEGEE